MANTTQPRTSSYRDHEFSIESWMVAGGRDRRPGSPLNVPPIPASNFILGEDRAYARDDGTPTWEALEEILGGLEGGSSVAFASGMAGIADLIWLESPSNPLLTVGYLDTICAAPRKPGAILGVDNTFATPINQPAIEPGS